MKISYSAKKMLFLVLISSFCLGGGSSGALFPEPQTQKVLDWGIVIRAYNSFINCPSQENAKAFLAVLPEDKPAKEIGNAELSLRDIFSSDNLPIFFGEANAGERTSVEACLRLLNISDGFYLETILATLGGIVRNHPRLFLEVLFHYEDMSFFKRDGFPVSFIGTGYNVHPKAAIYMLEKRIEALENIKDPKYEKIKTACIHDLRQAIFDLNVLIKAT